MKSLKDLIEEIRREGSGEAPREAPAPTRRRRSDSQVEASDFDLLFDVDLIDDESAASPEAPAAPPPPLRVPQPVVEPATPERGRKVRRRRLHRGARRFLVLLVALAVGTAGGVIFTNVRDGGPRIAGGGGLAGGGFDQEVVAWALWQEEPEEILLMSVVGVGGGREPVALGIPEYTITTIPGFGFGTVGDAIARQDAELAAAAAEGILGLDVDTQAISPLSQLETIVDAIGGITVRDRRLDGAGALGYLQRGSEGVVSAEFQFLRWQEVLEGVLRGINRRPEVLVGLPPEVAGVLSTAGAEGIDMLELPVEDVGAGLAKPDVDALSTLLSERFVSTADVDVGLVILNGEGTPGLGGRVANVLVPRGFELVSSLNAPTFDVEGTLIVAARKEFLDEAEIARDLLGVGEVFLGEQPTSVAEVTVIIGADFA